MPKCILGFLFILFYLILFIFPDTVFAVNAYKVWFDGSNSYTMMDSIPSSGNFYWEDIYSNDTGCSRGTTYTGDLTPCLHKGVNYSNTCCTSSGGCRTPDNQFINLWDYRFADYCKIYFDSSLDDCIPSYSYSTSICGATDTCEGSPYLWAGACNPACTGQTSCFRSEACTVGGLYKTCCNGDGTVDGNCNGGQFTGTCPGGTTTVICGVSSCAGISARCTTRACGEDACSILKPPPTPTPTPLPRPDPTPTNPPSNYCTAAGYFACTPGQANGTCTLNGQTCTAYNTYQCNFNGQAYCDRSGCAAPCNPPPTPPPPPGGCKQTCAANGCRWNESYAEGNCWSNWWYSGPGCYYDENCKGTGGTDPSSVSCTATNPTMLGRQTTIAVTQNPAHVGGWDGDACFNEITARISKVGQGEVGSCTTSGFSEGERTRECRWTAPSPGDYSVYVYNPAHSDPRRFECVPGTTDQCSWVGCDQAASDNRCSFRVVDPIPLPPGNPSALCPPPGSQASFSWNISAGATDYEISLNQGAGQRTQNNLRASLPTIPGSTNTWNVKACNSYGCSRASSGNNFQCPPPQPINLQAECNPPGRVATLTWNASYGARYYIITVNGREASNNFPGTSYRYNTTPGSDYSYSVKACNDAGCSIPSVFNFACESDVGPWIRTENGDVHSNIRIHAPGGP